MKWPLFGCFGLLLPPIIFILLKFWPEVVFQQDKHSVWKILQNFEFMLKCNAPKFLQFWSILGPIYHRKTKDIV